MPLLRCHARGLARSTGGRAFFPRHPRELDRIFDDVVSELANQYVLSYSSTNLKQDNAGRHQGPGAQGQFDIRARRGYRPQPPTAGGEVSDAQSERQHPSDGATLAVAAGGSSSRPAARQGQKPSFRSGVELVTSTSTLSIAGAPWRGLSPPILR